jgi:dolichol-phosphate mannosyltransferase
MENHLFVSVVSPVYQASGNITELVKRIVFELSQITDRFEIILVEDGSTDDSWNEIVVNCRLHGQVKGIKLSKNYGQHYAITAGLEYSKGDYVVVMDCDLQHDPVHIKDLVNAARQGYDIVYTVVQDRAFPFLKNILSGFFYSVFNLLTDTAIASKNVGSYSLLTRKAVDAFCRYKDFHRHYLLIVRLLGFRSTQVSIIHHSRAHGKSSYSLGKLINHAVDGITSQSTKLLRLIVGFGLFFVLGSLITALVIIYRYSVHGFLPGWTSLIVVILLCTGAILLSLGVIGIYISKMFDQVKNRPLYLVEQLINFEP